jgi:trans-aconitate methyltransferase
VHFLVVREIVRAIPGALRSLRTILDLGCGTGAAGAAWALESRTRRISGIDRHPWAVAESTWTYRALGLRGRSRQGDFSRGPFRVGRGSGIIAAYAINELPVAHREILLDTLIAEHAAGASVLIVEPIARMVAPWWAEWTRILHRTGGRSDEWRVAADLPGRQRELAGAAGLDPRVLTARSLWLESASS